MEYLTPKLDEYGHAILDADGKADYSEVSEALFPVPTSFLNAKAVEPEDPGEDTSESSVTYFSALPSVTRPFEATLDFTQTAFGPEPDALDVTLTSNLDGVQVSTTVSQTTPGELVYEDGAGSVAVRFETIPGGVTVYNFEVARTHTYFVGLCSVWVHNSCTRYDEYLEFVRLAGSKHPFPAYAGQVIPNAAKPRIYRDYILGRAIADAPNYQGWSAKTFRLNLKRRTGKETIDVLGMHAHHVIPTEFEKEMAILGIFVHDPKYGTWWDAVGHIDNAYGYNDAWRTFLRESRPTSRDQVEAFARKIAGELGLGVNF